MDVFEIIVALLLGGAALAAVARRLGVPYPALLALVGAGLALVPGVPAMVLDPELALALFVAPVLLDAAFDASPRDLRANWRAITSLALGAVVLTVLLVAGVAKLLVPGMPWAAAVALGAIVAPPDAAAATAVLKQLRPPHRLLVILEGESLFNDASALLVYRLAVAAAITGTFSGWGAVPTLGLVLAGSVALAFVLSWVTLAITRRICDVATAVIFQFGGAFAVWMIAERLHLSGIITTVVFAMLAARRAPQILSARIRVPSWAVWEVATFVLNVLSFVLVGMQLKSIIARTGGSVAWHYALVAGLVCVTTIVARAVWVAGETAVARAFRCESALSRREATAVAWCGMRGTVTLAAALALPDGGATPFPNRDVMIITAFGVVLGTLVVQGMTLRPLMAWLRLKDDGKVDRETCSARVAALRAGVAAVAEEPTSEISEFVRQRFDLQLRRAKRLAAANGCATVDVAGEEEAADGALIDQDGDVHAMRVAFNAQRHRLVALRTDGTIGDTAFQRVEEEIDRLELGWTSLLHLDGVESGVGASDKNDPAALAKPTP